MRLLSGGKLFFCGQQILLAENMVNGLAQYKFGLTYWYHLFLVTKNIKKVYKEYVCDFIRFLQFYLRRCDISGTLVVPWVVFVVLDSLLGVPIALFF